MVKGLEEFKKWFSDYTHCYILIGGTASTLAMEELGGEFRATKDLDIVLIIEALDSSFVSKFWDFIREGGYENRQKSTGKRLFYRFYKPSNRQFPEMVELFSRKPDTIDLGEGSELTPIPTDDEVSSLSAILMDDDYYQFVRSQKKVSDGLTYLGAEALIPLKARAFSDLSDRVAAGERIDSKNIKKHKNDIFRLFTILDPTISCLLPNSVKSHLAEGLVRLESETVDLKSLNIRSRTQQSVIDELRRYYDL